MLPVAILAGGLATRLRPLSETIPKSLVEVAGRPFLHWQLELLRCAGISEVTLCTGHLGDMIEKEIGDGTAFGMHVRYSPDGDRLLGTGGALKKALPILQKTFFVLYGDSYLPISYAEVEAAFGALDCDALMTVYENKDQWDRSNVWFQDGALRSYDKKVKHPAMRHIDYGLSIVSRDALAEWPDDEPFDLADVFGALARKGRLGGKEVFQRFYEIGSLSGISELDELLRKSFPPTSTIHPSTS